MSEQTDVSALRRRSLEAFRKSAGEYLAQHSDVQSMVLGVSQYFADEAGDAVHERCFTFRTLVPTWPHQCRWGEAQPVDGSRCNQCEEGERLPWGELDSNTEAVSAWSALCTEWGGGEGESERVDPIAIARRGEDGTVELELIHEVVRPWLDDNTAAQQRDEEFWEEEALPPAPEPVRPSWSSDERPLIDAVLAHPLDDAPRRVLVDFWLERHDVRGEFGALSFEPPATAKLRARRLELELEHGRTWLGPLQQAIGHAGARFGRGPFAQRVGVTVGDWRHLDDLKDLEDWALVEAIQFVGDGDAYFSPHMRGLREVGGVSEQGLTELLKVNPRAAIHTLGLRDLPSSGADGPPLAGLTTLRLERVHSWSKSSAKSWADWAPWSRLKNVEVWFALQHDEVDGWTDGRGAAALRTLSEVMPAGSVLRVGYHAGNGARRGVVARLEAGASVEFETRGLANEAAARRAHDHLAGQITFDAPPPLPEPGVVATATERRTSALDRFLAWFRK